MDRAIREAVQAAYGRIGREGSGAPGGLDFPTGPKLAYALGYPKAVLDRLPEETLEGFVGAAPLPGELLALRESLPAGRILDGGCGAGVDALWLAGEGLAVTALDLSREMLARLSRTTEQAQPIAPVRPVRGLLPELPFAEDTFAAALLNGVANIVPDKESLARAMARVLKPGGRLLIADVLALEELDPGLRDDAAAWAFCVGGAQIPDQWQTLLRGAGFTGIAVELLETFPPLGRGVVRASVPKPPRGE